LAPFAERQNVFLVADGGDHDDARVGVLPHDALNGSMPSIWGMVMSMRTMSGLIRLNSAMR